MGDLASHLHVTPRTITDLVDALEREGMLIRKPHPTDRKATLLELTEIAQANFKKVKAAKRKLVEEIFEPLNTQEKLQLIELLKKVQDGSISELDESDSEPEE